MSKYVFVVEFQDRPAGDVESIVQTLQAAMRCFGPDRLFHGELEDAELFPKEQTTDSTEATAKQMWFLGKLARDANARLQTSTGDDYSRINTALEAANEYLKTKQPIAKALCSQLIDALKGALDA